MVTEVHRQLQRKCRQPLGDMSSKVSVKLQRLSHPSNRNALLLHGRNRQGRGTYPRGLTRGPSTSEITNLPKLTILWPQCFAVSCVVLNMISYGLTIGYNASLFSELRKTQEIPLDIDSESWLASLIGLSLCVGSIVCSLIMEIIGRKPAIIMSSVFTICGWISFSLASTFPVLLIGKIVQGISVGIGTTMGCILVAEYSSPKYRGSFIAAMPPAMLIGGLIAHSFGLFYGWHDLSTILIFFSLPGLIVAVLSPESPSYLVVKGRYDECRKVFRWLREKSEDDEVEAMIKTHMILKQSKKNQELNFFKLIKIKFIYVVTAVKKRECRIPIIIMMHLSAINQFCGSIVQEMYALDIHNALYGTDTYMFKVITSLDLQRIIATVSAIYITSKLKRRSMLLIFVALTVIANVCIAGYIYARHHDLVWLDHMAIGIFLHHFHTFVIGTGCLPLAFIIGGEIYPLADKGFCVTICNVLSAAYMFVNIKSAPYLFTLIGVDGAYCLNALILVYSLIVIMVMLPETKNRTLQEIEDEFRGFAVVGNHEDAFDLRCNEIEDNENL